MRFSILIPSYNHGRFVAEAVDSCLRQDFPRAEYEVVVVEDGSTDRSPAVLETYAAAGDIRLVRQQNLGQGAAYAAALAASTGEYVCLLDADDRFAPDKLSAVAAWLDRVRPAGPHLFLCHDLDILDQAQAGPLEMTWLQAVELPATVAALGLEGLIDHPRPYPFAVPAGQILARRTLTQVIAGMDTAEWRRGADGAIGWGAVLAAGTVHYLHQTLGSYRVHDANGFMALQSGRLVGKVQPFTRWAKLLRFMDGFIDGLEHDGADCSGPRRLRQVLAPRLLQTQQESIVHFVPAPAGAAVTAAEDSGLRTRDDVAALLRRLLAAVEPRRSAGGARISLGDTAADYPQAVAEMEGFCRLLWGMVPAAAGACGNADWAVLRKGLINGIDPTHAEYWGGLTHFDQRAVEIAAVAYGLCLAPDQLWQPLPATAKAQLLAYLDQVNHCRVHDNNWLSFRVLVNTALARLGFPVDAAARAADLDRLESFHVGDGWYRDGTDGACDHYSAYVLQFYALICCATDPAMDAELAARLRERARHFALQFIHWFAADGAAVPFGRSLHYRFAPAAFWGALALAGVEALPWGVIKGLYLRHLRWWLAQPVLDGNGLLTLGHAYANLNLVESYASPASPYWALKAFVALALPATHPFWSSEEMPMPVLPETVVQRQAGMVVARDADADHVRLFPAPGPLKMRFRHGAEKYAKFCYSNQFGFSVPSAASGLPAGAHDNMLALSEEGEYFRVRGGSTRIDIVDGAIVSEWAPWPDVLIRSWVLPAGFWHVLVHRVQTARRLVTVEGGFALPRRTGFRVRLRQMAERDVVIIDSGGARSVIVGLLAARNGMAVPAAANTNVLHPATLIPVLRGNVAPGVCWLGCAVGGEPRVQDDTLPGLPVITLSDQEFGIADHAGRLLFRGAV